MDAQVTLAVAAATVTVGLSVGNDVLHKLYNLHAFRYTYLRPYQARSTASRSICKVKLLRALSVLWWGTTWESEVP